MPKIIGTQSGKVFTTPKQYQINTIKRIMDKCPDAKIYTAKNPVKQC